MYVRHTLYYARTQSKKLSFRKRRRLQRERPLPGSLGRSLARTSQKAYRFFRHHYDAVKKTSTLATRARFFNHTVWDLVRIGRFHKAFSVEIFSGRISQRDTPTSLRYYTRLCPFPLMNYCHNLSRRWLSIPASWCKRRPVRVRLRGYLWR